MMSDPLQEILEEAKPFLLHLNKARKRARIYPRDHPYVAESLHRLFGSVENMLLTRDSVTLSVADGDLYVEGRQVPDDTLMYEGMVVDLTRRGLTSVTFHSGVGPDELTEFILLSVAKFADLERMGGVSAGLKERAVRNIAVDEKSLALPGEGGETADNDGSVRVTRELYRSAVQAVIAAYADVSARQMMNVELVESVVRLLVAGVLQRPDLYLGLSAMKSYHEYTFYHSVNVAILSMLIGAKLHLNETLLNRLGVAALLHDIGKVHMPIEILDKPGRLTEDEFRMMQGHSSQGARILTEQGADPLAVLAAAQHHAHYDMNGYPDLKRVGDLHFISHLITVADVYDALTSDRSYRTAMLPDRAMQIIIEGRGSTFHPYLAKVFANLTGMFPVGTLVELDSDELAVVCKPNPDDVYRPQVKILSEPFGDSAVFRLVDLTEKSRKGDFVRRIVRSREPGELGIDVTEYV